MLTGVPCQCGIIPDGSDAIPRRTDNQGVTYMTHTVTEAKSLTISWGPASGIVTGYRVYRDGVLRTNLPGDRLEVSSSVLGISEEGVYSVEVAAINTSGEGPKSSASVEIVNHPLPSAPGPVVIG